MQQNLSSAWAGYNINIDTFGEIQNCKEKDRCVLAERQDTRESL